MIEVKMDDFERMLFAWLLLFIQVQTNQLLMMAIAAHHARLNILFQLEAEEEEEVPAKRIKR